MRFDSGKGAGSDGIFVFQEQVAMTQSVLDKTKFLNVDLDISSKFDVQPLVTAMGKRVSLSFVGRVERMYYAHMDLAIGNPKSPESAILEYCRLIHALPAVAKKDWDAVKTRRFDIGIEAPGPQNYYWFALSPKALKAAADVNAQIAFTIYGPMKTARKPRKVTSAK